MTTRDLQWWLIGVLAASIAVIWLAKEADAHDAHQGWAYDPYCCSDKDCHEIAADRVKGEPGGYVVDGRHHKTHHEVRFSPDGLYHACFFPDENTLRCLYVPPSGS